ncbi:MAG: sensor domain-containing diguanylate cyclase [Myxococcota bacterium]|nr:sensor domain-containing diguanylate cyclase [Myxococcota bacterium]
MHVFKWRDSSTSTTGNIGNRDLNRRARIGGPNHALGLWRWAWGHCVWALRKLSGFVIGLAALSLAVSGYLRSPSLDESGPLAVLVGLVGFLLLRLFFRLRPATEQASVHSSLADAEIGTLFVATTYSLVECMGGPAGLLQPLVYVLVAFLVAFHPTRQALWFIALMLAAEASIAWLQPSDAGWRLAFSHSSFVMLFAFLFFIFLRGEVVYQRRQFRRELDTELRSIVDEANDFRLTSALSLETRDLSPDELRTRRNISSVQAIHDSLYNVLAVAERALRPYTVALFWIDSDGRRLRLKELRSESDVVVDRPMGVGEGLLGAIIKQRKPVVLSELRAGHPGLVYYDRPEKITDFIGVPISEGQHIRGVLVADRIDGCAFTTGDIDVMSTMAEEISRAVQVERIFAQMDQEKFQKERFYQASRDFNSALTVDQVARVAIHAARRVSGAEFAALCVSAEEEGWMQVGAIDWHERPQYRELEGSLFLAHEGLVGAAIKARHPLPHGGLLAKSQHIFAPGINVSMKAVQVLPLLWKDVGVGALVIGSAEPAALSLQTLEMLRVIADHAAIAIANAQMYEKMETLATTDGLTGLTNHRNFQELFDSLMLRSERYNRKFSLVLCDIDHFKSVNDTYGHPIGDVVLKKVARVLKASARGTDIVARYGGEEFAILMEEAEGTAAVATAERIRESVKKEVFHSDIGSFSCTMSLGVATFPEDATQKGRLTVCADEALYAAKHGGRDQVVRWADMKTQQKQAG